MVTTPRRWTLADLELDGGPEGLWEIIEGELIEMPPAGARHGRVWSAIHAHLWQHVVPQRLGYVYGADTGFILSEEPFTVRVPDVSVVKSERLPANFDDGGMLAIPPDLVVEVLSPKDRWAAVLAKTATWLEAGVALVWLVDPVAESVTVYGPVGSQQYLTGDQVLDGGDILPGFTLPLRNILAL